MVGACRDGCPPCGIDPRIHAVLTDVYDAQERQMNDRNLIAKITSCTNVVKQYRKIVAFCINFSHNDESMNKTLSKSENVRPPCLQHKISSVKSPADASTPQKHRAACALLRDLPFHQCRRSIPVKFIQIMLDNAHCCWNWYCFFPRWNRCSLLLPYPLGWWEPLWDWPSAPWWSSSF